MDFYYLREVFLTNIKISASKKVHKSVEATDKIPNKIMKQKPVNGENSRNVEEIVIPSQKRRSINKLI